MGANRAERVGPLIQEEISGLLLQKLEDPRLKGITFTRVKMTKDLKIAHAYFSLIGDDEQIKAALAALEGAKRLFKRVIRDNLELRYIPDIQFHFDKNIEYADRIDRLLRQIHEDDEGKKQES